MKGVLAIALCLGLAACGGHSSDNNPPPFVPPPQQPTPPTVTSIADGCAQTANYLNIVRYQDPVPADVGYAVMLQEYCAGSQTTGLVPGSSDKVIAYFTNLVADANAYGSGGPLVIPAISTF